MTQELLFTRADMLAHGATSALLDGYRVRPIEVNVETAGSLGTMTAKWRFVGDGDDRWSVAEPSEAGAPWEWAAPDPAFAVLTFAAASYAAGDTWTVATDGTVTAQDTAPAALTAIRVDVIAAIRAGVTSDIVTWCQPRVVPPIVSLGDGQKAWASTIGVWRLKLRSGVTPADAGSGDAMLFEEAKRCEERFKSIGQSAMRPPDIVDSSAGNTGAGLSLMPLSDALQGW